MTNTRTTALITQSGNTRDFIRLTWVIP